MTYRTTTDDRLAPEHEPEIEVTPEMISKGAEVLLALDGEDFRLVALSVFKGNGESFFFPKAASRGILRWL